MTEQIVSHGHTPPYVWQELEQRSSNTRRKIVLRCPLCSGEIHPTDTTDLRCLSCDAPVEIYQHAEITETADTRIIYAEVSNAPFFAPQGAGARHSAQRCAVLSLDLQCLSCEQPLQADETCTNTCGIQTYLTLEIQDGELYIRRAANLPHVPRDTPEIEIRNLPDTDVVTRANETPHEENRQDSVHPVLPVFTDHQPLNLPPNQPFNQPHGFDSQTPEHPNRHTDIAGQIVEYLSDAENHTATTREMIAAIGCVPEGFNKARIKLLKEGRIRDVRRGVYQLIHQT